MNSSDSAEEIVKLYLEGIEHVIKVSGTGVKNIIALLIAYSKSREKQGKGKTSLNNMLKSGKPLNIFTFNYKDLKTFSREAKRYGIRYCVLSNIKNSKIDGMVDIIVEDDNSRRVNRIAERFNFKDVATIQKELELERKLKEEEKLSKDKTEIFIDEILPKEKINEKENLSNTKETVKENQLGNFLKNKKSKDKTINFNEKKSVKKELKEIEQEIKIKEKSIKDNILKEIGNIKDITKKAKRYKEKDTKGKRYRNPKHLQKVSSKNVKSKRSKERSIK